MQVQRTIKLAAVLAALLGARPLQEGGLEDLRFMSGCWRGTFSSERGPGTIEEHYTEPASNLMLGTTRYIVNGEVTMFEFSAIRRDARGVWLTPYPRGVASEHAFRLTSVSKGRAVFEAPEHDYPKRVVYRREPDGTLVARIDAGEEDPEGSEWRMTSAGCVAAASSAEK
jgi:hypothetical protein